MLTRGILLLVLAAVSTPCAAIDPAPPAPNQNGQARPPSGPKNFLGRDYPGKITGLTDDGVTVHLRNGGTQVVQFAEIWRIRKAFASDEPAGSSVIDYANTRLFVATPFETLVTDLGRKVPMTKLTAPNGEIIYMVATKVTDISRALPGLHNPASKAVIGTRDGTQQVLEAVDEAKRIIADAQVTP